MSDLEKEIKSYHILGLMLVRGREREGKFENKCLWEIEGKSMLQWVLGSASASKYIEKVVVGSENEEVRKIIEEAGAITIARPLEQVIDHPRDFRLGKYKRVKPRSLRHKRYDPKVSSVDYVLERLKEKEGYVADLIVRLSTELPLVKTESIDRLIETFFRDPEAELGIMISLAAPKHYFINEITGRVFPLWIDNEQGTDRQEYPHLFTPGGVHIKGRAAATKTSGWKTVHIVVDEEEGMHVHNERDLFLARCYMKNRMKGGEKE